MVSVTQKSRNCLLLLLSLYQSMCPPFSSFFFTLLAVSLWPALALAALRTPKEIAPSMGHSNKSTSVPTHNVSTASPAIFNSPTATQSSYFYFPSTSPSSLSELRVTTPSNSVPSTSIMSVPLFDQTSPEDVLITSPTASTKVRHFGKKSSLSQDSSHCSVLQPFNQISRLLPHTCKHSTHKSRGSSLHKTLQSLLSEISLHPLQTAKPPSSPTSLFPLSDSTLPPASSQNASHKLPSPLSTSSSPTFITSPPPPPKPSPVPLPKRSPSPPEATPSHQPGPLLPPSLQHATDPLFEHQPFTVTWNIPDLVCNKYNISLDTSPFKGVATPAKVPGQFLSLFYTDRLGLYPHVDLTSRKKFHGGIPQRSNLRASMNKARADINYYIPSKTTRGLAVIDWEEWRPLWDRNWGTKRIYQSLSVAHVLQTNRSLTVQEATEKAKQQFQEAAKSFMSGMLAMGRAMRPNYLWGFYLFPNCYNYGWHEPDYTGQCSKEVRRQNDELLWLWESSTALYPSVYLQESLADDPKAALMVRNRVQEALRVSALPGRSATAPVFVYMRPVFVDQNRRFLSQVDLVSTIGESAAVGASGAVLWGASADYDDQTSCKALSSYLTSTLNPYITNVTVATQLCSNFLCRGNGRCVRKSYKSNHYLHLNAENFRVVRIQSRYLVVGRPTFANLKALSRRFTCRCYKGLSCSPRTHRELAKALMFSLKQGLYKKSRALIKTALDDTQQTSITKDNVKKNFNV